MSYSTTICGRSASSSHRSHCPMAHPSRLSQTARQEKSVRIAATDRFEGGNGGLVTRQSRFRPDRDSSNLRCWSKRKVQANGALRHREEKRDKYIVSRFFDAERRGKLGNKAVPGTCLRPAPPCPALTVIPRSQGEKRGRGGAMRKKQILRFVGIVRLCPRHLNLSVSGSHGQGVFVSNDSHASLTGASITGSNHGGMVVANLSTIAVGTETNPFTQD